MMAAPFKLDDLVARADANESALLAEEEYRDDLWADDALGPLLKAYALLTHLPNEAFEGSTSDEKVAIGRLYAFARLARLHLKRDGCECLEVDGFEDLYTEYDADWNSAFDKAVKAGQLDANRQFTQLKKSGKAEPMDH